MGLAAVREEVPNRKRAVEDLVGIPDLPVIGCGFYLLPRFPEQRMISFVLFLDGQALLILMNFWTFT